jgi:hypothetical protein
MGESNAPQVDTKQKYLPRIEAAEFLHTSVQTLDALTKAGKFTAFRIGNRILYKVEDLENGLLPTNRFVATGKKRGPKPRIQA